MAGRAHHHKPEDDFQTGERARLSFGDHLQGRTEHASCYGEAGPGEEELGGEKKKERIVRFQFRVRLLSG